MYEDLGPPPTDGERDRSEGNDPPQADAGDPGLLTSRPTKGGAPPTMEAPSKNKGEVGFKPKGTIQNFWIRSTKRLRWQAYG